MRGLGGQDAGIRWPGCGDQGARMLGPGGQGARTTAPVDYSPDHDTRTELARPWRLVRLACDTGRGPRLIALFFPRQ
jgi:hypothetical protein